jgi:hypothetical protein
VGQKKKLLGWALAAAAAVAAGLFLSDSPSRPEPQAQAPERPARSEPQSTGQGLGLPSRDGLSRPRGDLFATPPAPARPKAERTKAVAEPAPPPQPVAPPMPYRVAGQVVHNGPPRVVLARDDRVFFVAEGDLLEGGYRVESIKPEGVTLVYMPLDQRQHLAAASALQIPDGARSPSAPAAEVAQPKGVRGGDARPAQVRWEGPTHVQAGSEFEVSLKITSDQAVRSSPLQLSYDAKVLEPVAVRAGEFYAEGSFTYRVNPGSIFVGASGKGGVPADAEFLVVTFKPIRSGATTELKLASLVLQGARGALVHEPLAAFRTSISQ